MKLDHINIVVRDLPAAREFFQLFGYSADDEAELRGDWISQVVGLQNVEASYLQLVSAHSAARIELITYHRPPSPSGGPIDQANAIGYRHIAFSVDDIEHEVARLKAAGVKFLSPIHTYARTGKQIIYGKGPEGILIELAQYAE